MGHIILVILFMAAAIFISNRRTAATTAGTPKEPSGNRRVREKAAVAGSPATPQPYQRANPHRPLADRHSAAHVPLLDPAKEGESVTGFSSGTTVSPKSRKAKDVSPATSSPAADAHYARWRQAVIDATVLTPLQ